MAAILADDNFKSIFVNENYIIPIRISLKFVPVNPIDNKPALVQVMACSATSQYLNQCWLAWTNADPIQWRMYAALEVYEFISVGRG